MYEVSVKQHFDAAHYLRDYGGECARLHGHRFQVVVSVKVKELDEVGIAWDFVRLKQSLRDIVERYDHTCLNDTPPFNTINPSSENIATTIYGELQARLEEDIVSISSVKVCESPDAWVTYTPEHHS